MKIPEKVKRAVAKFYLRYQRGNSLANFLRDIFIVIAGGSIIMDFAYYHFNIVISPYLILSLAVLMVIVFYLIGTLDEHYGFWKLEARYGTEVINPYFKEMMNKIDRIERKIG